PGLDRVQGDARGDGVDNEGALQAGAGVAGRIALEGLRRPGAVGERVRRRQLDRVEPERGGGGEAAIGNAACVGAAPDLDRDRVQVAGGGAGRAAEGGRVVVGRRADRVQGDARGDGVDNEGALQAGAGVAGRIALE